MRANSDHHQPLGFLHPVGIGFGILQIGKFDVFGRVDLGGGAMPDVDRLAAPDRGNGLTLFDRREVQLR